VDGGVDLQTALINKATLKAICDNKGITDVYLAGKLKNIDPSKVADWLNTNSRLLPTFVQAKEIAKCLKVPFAGLYMNPDDVPKQSIPKITNRRVFQNGFSGDDSSLNIAVADLIRTRNFFLSTKRELEEQVVPFNVTIRQKEEVKLWATEIRKIFQLELAEQFKLPSSRQFYLYVREKVESKGVFIHCFVDVDVLVARGVAISDGDTPIIGINNNDRYPAKTFTIIHELTHLLKHESSLCNEFFSHLNQQQEEVFCNAVAGEVLVPQEALLVKLSSLLNSDLISMSTIADLASDFSVSKEVITRRLFDIGKITKDAYDAYFDEFARQIDRDKAEQKAQREAAKLEGRDVSMPRDMVRETIDKTSTSLCLALIRGYNEELFSKLDVSRYLGINARHADRFIGEVSKWSN
jgi:Zn-dependent peptidase ImmA (M78 family)